MEALQVMSFLKTSSSLPPYRLQVMLLSLCFQVVHISFPITFHLLYFLSFLTCIPIVDQESSSQGLSVITLAHLVTNF